MAIKVHLELRFYKSSLVEKYYIIYFDNFIQGVLVIVFIGAILVVQGF